MAQHGRIRGGLTSPTAASTNATIGAVTTCKTMLPEHPDVTQLGNRFPRRLQKFVRPPIRFREDGGKFVVE